MAKQPQVKVQIIKSSEEPEPVISAFHPIQKSDKSEQINRESAYNADEWIGHLIDMHGMKNLVDESTILPQCIKAYKSNIAGFGISVRYKEDYDEENAEMTAEFNRMESILELLNMDMPAKEVFENIIRDRETYGIAYAEVIRNFAGEVAQLDFIVDTPSIDMTYPLEPYMDIDFFYKGKSIMRKKKFRKYRQNVAGKTVYFKEFGDPRIMNKVDGTYADDGEIDVDLQANEIIDFRVGSMPYGEIRWLGQVLTVDGNRRAEILNNNYFRQGRHVPLMIAVKGGTLSDESFRKLKEYMNDIKGESGQHAFLLLEVENNEATTGMTDVKQPEIELKDLASILQKDELFQDYLENGRKKTQSSFLLPDLYVGYTADFNRATAQTAMEVTEKQVFQPERSALAWVINNRLLNGYGFQYVEAYFEEPDITNPDDIQKILNITERAGGLTPNTAKELTHKTIGKSISEDYDDEWGNIPIQYTKAMQSQPVTPELMQQMDSKIQKAAADDDLMPILKEIRKALQEYDNKGAV